MILRTVTRHTYSVCPVCLKRIPAVHVSYGKEIYLEKTCPEHGPFSSIIWRGLRDIEAWRGSIPPIAEGENEDCPNACGLCVEHRQDTCCVLLEVTKRCNLRCPFCFAEGGDGEDIPLDVIVERLKALAVPGKTLVQLSGGEPTVRNDLPEIVAAAKDAGCQYVQLNTNAIRLGQDSQYVKSLKEAGLSFVFMQFDGMDDGIYRTLRGKDLLSIKKQAIHNCARHNLGVTLVPTIVPGVNTQDIGNMIRFAISQSPGVRGVHFQPVSYFGRVPTLPSDAQRFTLDELLDAIEDQAGALVPMDSLLPSRCDHPLCGFHGDYIVMPDQVLYPLHRINTSSGNATTADQNRSFVARKWQRPKPDEVGKSDSTGPGSSFDSFTGFIRRIRSHSFTLTAMAFQDAGNLDLERLRRCSLHVFDDGRFVPFCAYYLTTQICYMPGHEGSA
jgi:uncharacterized radical SAM superfamily Fe-S cluster-containing enzyme